MARYNLNYYESDLEYITSRYPDTLEFDEELDDNGIHIESGMTREDYLESDEYRNFLREYVLSGKVADYFCAPADFY